MKKPLTSLLLLLVLAGGAFAGVPLHFGESECSMGAMNMDCCKAMLMKRESHEVDAAELLCLLDCAQNGTTAPPSIVRVTPPSQSLVFEHRNRGQAMQIALAPLQRIDRFHGPPSRSNPAYIRHLALLI